MTTNILKLKPHFEYRVWAGTTLKQAFNLSPDGIGEAWLISALEGKAAVISNLPSQPDLLKFYSDPSNANFFASYNLTHPYPLLAKIIDARADLSVQIHPDDDYARQFGMLGKTECWYVLDTAAHNEVVLGHHASTLADFKQRIAKRQWSQLLKSQPIHPGAFIYVPARKIHAIKANTLIYELQQSSDITYRVYDYDRLDRGHQRELHLDHVYNLIETPDRPMPPEAISARPDYLVANHQFNLKLITNVSSTTYAFPEAKWVQLSVIEGCATIDDLPANLYDSFLIAHQSSFTITGSCKCLVSYIK